MNGEEPPIGPDSDHQGSSQLRPFRKSDFRAASEAGMGKSCVVMNYPGLLCADALKALDGEISRGWQIRLPQRHVSTCKAALRYGDGLRR